MSFKLSKSMLAVSAMLFVFAVAAPVYAIEGEETPVTRPKPVVSEEQKEEAEVRQENAQKRREETQLKATENREARQAKLTNSRLKACQRREAVITKLMANLADRGTRQIEVFDKIADRTQVFYQEKGRTLDNYNALVAEVDAKKAAAEAAVQTTKDTVVEFDCDGDDPKGAGAEFKENLKAQHEAMKAYKTAVKNLIVGVKSVQGEESTTDNSGEQE